LKSFPLLKRGEKISLQTTNFTACILISFNLSWRRREGEEEDKG